MGIAILACILGAWLIIECRCKLAYQYLATLIGYVAAVFGFLYVSIIVLHQ
jgi:hypothetical protein